MRLEIKSLKIKISTRGRATNNEAIFGKQMPPSLVIHCSNIQCYSANRRWEEVPINEAFTKTADEILVNKIVRVRSINCWFVPDGGMGSHVHVVQDFSPVVRTTLIKRLRDSAVVAFQNDVCVDFLRYM